MAQYSVQKIDFEIFIKGLAEKYRTFYLKDVDSQIDWKEGSRKRLSWQEYKDSLEGLVIGGVRAHDPLKQFIFTSKQKVSQDFKSLEKSPENPLLLIGAKNCDLTGLDITDFVFLQGDFKDPFYVCKRENMFIIASDCSNPIDTCFCSALGRKPFPEKNYDMAIADIGEEYVIEVVSEKAKQYVSDYQTRFQQVTQEQLKRRQTLRESTSEAVGSNISKNGVPMKDRLAGVMEKGFDSKVWDDEVQTCVECGCCNVICPTCHCFFLGDSQEKNTAIRLRIWDACLYKDFAVVAGGANPRKRLSQRLRNRYDKKFSYFPSVLGTIACTGCGRCISGCPGKIDIRRILKNLVAGA